MMTLTTGTATKRASTGTTNRNHDEDNEVDGDQRRVFINHTITMTSIQPTPAPVHDRIRKTFLTIMNDGYYISHAMALR